MGILELKKKVPPLKELVVAREKEKARLALEKKPKNPTYGRIPTGHFEFTAEYTEVVIVLEGVLETEVNDSIHTTGRLESITAPSGSLLKIDVREHPVLYICEYR